MTHDRVTIFHINALFNPGFLHNTELAELKYSILQPFFENFGQLRCTTIRQTYPEFGKLWKQSWKIHDGAKTLFDDIEAHSNNHAIYWIGEIDSLQKEVIEEKYGELPGKRFLSCEKQLNNEHLWNSMLNDIYSSYPGINSQNISLYYNDPTRYESWDKRLRLPQPPGMTVQQFLGSRYQAEIQCLEAKAALGVFKIYSLEPGYSAFDSIQEAELIEGAGKTWLPQYRYEYRKECERIIEPALSCKASVSKSSSQKHRNVFCKV